MGIEHHILQEVVIREGFGAFDITCHSDSIFPSEDIGFGACHSLWYDISGGLKGVIGFIFLFHNLIFLLS
nr:MAG TPA: hypothetical protein [Caudoviricetes sp.]